MAGDKWRSFVVVHHCVCLHQSSLGGQTKHIIYSTAAYCIRIIDPWYWHSQLQNHTVQRCPFQPDSSFYPCLIRLPKYGEWKLINSSCAASTTACRSPAPLVSSSNPSSGSMNQGTWSYNSWYHPLNRMPMDRPTPLMLSTPEQLSSWIPGSMALRHNLVKWQTSISTFMHVLFLLFKEMMEEWITKKACELLDEFWDAVDAL